MASFYASEFLYGGISSTKYGVRIFEINDSGGTTTSDGGTATTIYKDLIFRRSKTNFYGSSTSTPLEFDITIGSYLPIPGIQQSLLKSWLIGSKNYQHFQVVQDDLSNIYWNCIFTKATDTHVGNLVQSFSFHAECDAPWAWEEAKTISKNYITTVNDTFSFYNSSADNDYMYPLTSFTMSSIGSSVIITNITDNNRQVIFTSLSPNEVIAVDNYNKILTSSTGLLRLGNSNLTFFRLCPGYNSINISGDISNFTMTTQNARKVGG